jgi:hypothetical protein
MRSIDERLKDLLARTATKTTRTGKKPRKPKGYTPIDTSNLEGLCETELVAIAKFAGYRTASRQMLPEDLISLILGEADEPIDCLAEPRGLLHSYVKANTSIMASMMPCDLHCPTCPHHMVVECFTVNRDLVE